MFNPAPYLLSTVMLCSLLAGSAAAQDGSGKFVDLKDIELAPVAIEHNVQEIFIGHRLEQRYNYIDYHFESDGHYYRAPSYVDDISNVAIFSPFENRQTLKLIDGQSPNENVMGYLKRRYKSISVLSQEGYRTIWRRD